MSDLIPVTPKPPPRAEVSSIIRRYLKDEILKANSGKVPAQEYIQFYRLWKAYPSKDFWIRHELGFQLHSLFWFSSEDGAAHLQRDWTIFHFVFPSQEVTDPVPAAPVDKTESSLYHRSATSERPRTVAGWLGSPATTTTPPHGQT